MKIDYTFRIASTAGLVLLSWITTAYAVSSMNDYCNIPPFVAQSVPPLVLLETGRDHKFYYNAYNDGSDLDEDGRLDNEYKHSIDYYGYFDPVKCYTYDTTNKVYNPVGFSGTATNAYSLAKYSHQYTKFCAAGQFSGNVLNWMTMSRMDVLRKVLYGGHRSTDSTTSTILERVYVPRDAHAWAKELTGRLCKNLNPDAATPQYGYNCVTDADCDAAIGYDTCEDKSNQLIGIAASPQVTACTANVTVNNPWDTQGKIFVAQYDHTDTGDSHDLNECGATNNNLLSSFEPTRLRSYRYITTFADTAVGPPLVDPNGTGAVTHTNLIAVAEFKSTVTGDWSFLVDGDDGVEIAIAQNGTTVPTVIASAYGCHSACFTGTATAPTDPNDSRFDLTATNTAKSWCDGSNNTPVLVPPSYTAPKVLVYTVGTTNTWHRIVVRQTNNTSHGGFKVWYKKPGETASDWRVFGVGTAGAAAPASDFVGGTTATSTLRAPTITTTNNCSINDMGFIENGLPVTTAVNDKRHLFCNVTDTVSGNAAGDTGATAFVPGPPLLKFLNSSTMRLWNWGAKEKPVCSWRSQHVDTIDTRNPAGTTNGAVVDTTNSKEYVVRVKVCDSAYIDWDTNFERCKKYISGTTTTYKPTGLLQKYGEGIVNDKVCSRAFSKTCTADTDCTTATEGLCIPRVPMYFGLMTGSYTKSTAGGLLRKDISAISDEITANGIFDLADKTQGNLIRFFERARIVGYNTSSFTYDSTPPFGGGCTPFTTMNTTNGTCRDWGNPVAEMMYEGLRYFSGKGVAETNYDTTDAWISTKQNWGIPKTSTTTPLLQVYGTTDGTTADPSDATSLKRDNAIFPRCAKPFALVIADINPSYDTDQIPGTSFTTYTEDTNKPLLNINVSNIADTIGTSELINNNSWFIGQSTSTNYDQLCTSKSASANLSDLRGLCAEEPFRQGGYYAAAVAYYGKTLMQYQIDSTMNIKTSGTKQLKSGVPNVTTYAVPIASPIPEIKVKLGSSAPYKYITLVPFGKSVTTNDIGSSYDFKTRCWQKCPNKKIDGDGLALGVCNSDAYCGGQQIVPLYVDEARYDLNNNLTYGVFRINFEDSEQGNDHDMDAIVNYNICTKAFVDTGLGNRKGCKVCNSTLTSVNPKYCELDGDCGGTDTCVIKSNLTDDQVLVSLDNSPGASAGIDSALGFVISGTSGNRLNGTVNDGTYMPIRSANRPSTSPLITGNDTVVAGVKIPLPEKWMKVFTASGTSSQLLKDPLWYAAKWGGFTDIDANNKPNLAGEWAKNNGVDPDNYYLVVNPLRLETQLDKALSDILARTSSGTAASIVNKRQESGANLLTAVFYPQRDFENNTKLKWGGDLQNYWFYFDPLFANSGLREDTVADATLRLTQDYAVDMHFDPQQNKTVALRSRFDGTNYTAIDSKSPDDLNALWKAGESLFSRTSARRVYTNLSTPDFTGKNFAAGFSLFDTSAAGTLQTYLQTASTEEAATLISYTLGSDTPVSGAYAPVYRSRTVTNKGVSNVWKLGDIVFSTPKILSSIPVNNYHIGYDDVSYSSYINSSAYLQRGSVFVGANDGMFHAFKLGTVVPANIGDKRAVITGSSLGEEHWAFVPRNALPYLRYIADPNYEHVYTVDLTSTLVDVSINKPLGYSGASGAYNCSETNYWDCKRQPEKGNAITIDLASSTDRGKISWRSLVIGGMGLGGATRTADGTCSSTTTVGASVLPDCIKAPINTAGFKDVGLSSLFAIDVTDSANPSLMWEFSDPALGLSISEPAIVRVNGKTGTDVDPKTNGRWFAVFSSGPTGPINTVTHQMYGRSDQKLKIFVVDLATGALVRTFDTSTATDVGVLNSANAFGGTLFTNAVDTDAGDTIDTLDSSLPGFYSTDVVYISYARQGYDTDTSTYTWNVTAKGGGSQGGLLRLVTHEDTDPANWTLNTFIDGTGPVTSSIDRLYDRKDPETGLPAMWIYFGSGRYFYKDSVIDDADTIRSLYGIKDPCYKQRTKTNGSSFRGIDPACNTSVSTSELTNSTYILASYPAGKKGWYIDMLPSDLSFKAERNITTPIHRSSGLVTFTSFRPTADICGFGGETRQYFVAYNTGGLPPAGSLKGKMTIQLSTGAIVSLDLSKITSGAKVGDRPVTISLGLGKPPSQPPQDDRPKKPIKKILHIQER